MDSSASPLSHPFDNAIRLTGSNGHYQGQTTAPYANMVGPFGGVLAGVMLKAVLQHPQCQGEPVALTVNFLAPVADGDFTVDAKAVRTNRSTQHWYVELSQQGQVALTATAVFATRRETWSAPQTPYPGAPRSESVPAMPKVPGLPGFFANYDLRLVRGGIAPMPQAEARLPHCSDTLLWARDNPPRPLDFPALAALSDIFFPRLFVRRQGPALIGTVSMNIIFHADANTLARQGEQYLLGEARAHRFYNGYFDQSAELWSSDGELLVTTNQVVYYKE
ncbi:acyl-CoA thioesterase [Gallaecimonas pentaromativorans]|uniref:Thioesterase superfamily protein n=1 Tax=Gallaecimonas pentaromativorans TaxID=584787 RepID=A0A3N1PKY0_9GAMM|nr:thioesterase family protein [Gallaecimonas pentaromativorans]ROQ28528.1 thioesterase superfamily protein [Gallaecimonas pentaromativorans]